MRIDRPPVWLRRLSDRLVGSGWEGTWMVNNGYDLVLAPAALGQSADLVAFGWPFIKPELVARLQRGDPLNRPDRKTFYGGGEGGYLNYPLGRRRRTMKLYNYFRSSASYRVRIALALKGLPFEYVSVHLAKGAHLAPDYQDIAADGLVPLLELEDGTRLSQSMAIIEYLDDMQPEPRLLPVDALSRARVRALAQSIACEIHPINNLRVLNYLSGTLGVGEDAKHTWYRHWVRQGFEAFERQISQRPAGPYCWGDMPTLADCCLVPQIFNAKRFDTPLDGLSRIMAVFERCMSLPAFAEQQPSACPDAE